MSGNLWHRIATLWRADLFSPKDFVRRAVVVAIIFIAIHITGLRDYTCFLNGTVASPELGRGMSTFLGLGYVFAYLGFVLLVPILLIAAAMLAGWERLSRGGQSVTQLDPISGVRQFSGAAAAGRPNMPEGFKTTLPADVATPEDGRTSAQSPSGAAPARCIWESLVAEVDKRKKPRFPSS